MGAPGTEDDDRGLSPYTKAMRSAGPLLTAGIQLAASVVLMMFVGRWLDGKFGWTPWLMLAGMFLGLAAGLVQFLRTVNAVSRREAEDKARHDH
jgi:F0F1-type ATP synthase assembly protein I